VGKPADVQEPVIERKVDDTFSRIIDEGRENPDYVKSAPHNTVVGRLDEARAVKQPKLLERLGG
jgi:hypothetical protein